MVTIAKTFDFDAAHFLPKVPKDHKCSRMHGHTYRVEVRCSGAVDDRGMVLDYAEIEVAWMHIRGMIDHQVLNEQVGLENPTTEILAPWILQRFIGTLGPTVKSVRVYESSTTWCEASVTE